MFIDTLLIRRGQREGTQKEHRRWKVVRSIRNDLRKACGKTNSGDGERRKEKVRDRERERESDVKLEHAKDQ